LDMEYNAVLTAKNGDHKALLNSRFMDSLNHTNTKQDPRNFELGQYFRMNYQPQYEHTWKIDGNYVYKDKDHHTDWDFDRPVFTDNIPVQNDEESFNFIQEYWECNPNSVRLFNSSD